MSALSKEFAIINQRGLHARVFRGLELLAKLPRPAGEGGRVDGAPAGDDGGVGIAAARQAGGVQELDARGVAEAGNPGLDAVVVPGRVICLIVLQPI